MRLLSFIKVFFLSLTTRDEHARYRLAEFLANAVYPTFKFSEYGRAFLYDKEFSAVYERFVGKENYHSLDRKYTLSQLLKLVLLVDGDTAECGVYRGASSYFICQRIVGTGRAHHIFDSFEGISQPKEHDGNHWRKGDLKALEKVVRENLAEFDFVHYYRGWIPEKFEAVRDRVFSFVHVDVDLYEPTLDSLRFFYDRLSTGGMILCDDYGFITCPGARRAFDEFLADKPESLVELPTGQAFILKK
jgi:O-methyltransferase